MRSFTHVKDVVNINKLVALIPETRGQVYNCASGIKVTIQELADKILFLLGKTDLEIRYEDWKIGDIKIFDVSNQKLKNLGMVWQTDFDEGLRDTLNWSKDWLEAQDAKSDV